MLYHILKKVMHVFCDNEIQCFFDAFSVFTARECKYITGKTFLYIVDRRYLKQEYFKKMEKIKKTNFLRAF